MRTKLLLASLAGGLLLGMAACTSEDSFLVESEKALLAAEEASTKPVVRIDTTIVYPSSGSATLTGYLDDQGGSRVRIKGFVYSDTTNTPILKTGKKVLILNGPFSRTITDLTDDVEYYVRAFAINSTDTAYSEPIKMVTRCNPSAIITMPVVNRVKLAAIVCGQFTQMGEVEHYGACLSRRPNPTLEDTYVKAADIDTVDVKGSFGVWFDGLEPQTMYHVRAYAVQKDGKVIYGNDRIFQTTKGGNVTSTFWNGDYCLEQDPAAYSRIKQAIDSALWYYNNYSNLTKHINYNYSPGTPTADCNIEGWMRFGENERYQWVGTAQHEISHAMGVGTSSNWNALFSNGLWTAPVAKQALRVLMKDMYQELRLSGVHFWPGGINQREEVTNGTTNSYGVNIRNADMLKLNAMVLSAMREDGMNSW